MNLLEFAEKTSHLPLMPWQKEYLVKYHEAKRDGKELIVYGGRHIGRTMVENIIDQFYGKGEDISLKNGLST